jgi:AMMECR1 domain-containing protein
VNFSDINSQSKDYAPFLANALKDAGLDKNVVVILVSNFSYSSIMQDLVKNDSQALSSLQNIETDRFLYSREEFMTQNITLPNPSILGFGVLLFKCLAADHAEVLGYAVSSQLYLSKDKSTHTSFVTAAFSSEPRIHTVPSHVTQEKILEKFDELFRGDILTMTRQAIASMLDPTAAYPPALNSKEAGKKWPLYVTLYDPDGNIAGEAGSHVAIGPLEESIRKFAFEAVRQAKPALSKINFSNYVIEVSIPYGFHKVRSPEDLTPLLHGVIVSQKLKSVATHPNAWRTTSNPHQLLGSLCAQLGLNPWAYTTGEAALTSFRVLSFNEKEPFQDLGGGSKKKKRKKVTADDLANEEDENTGGGGGGGGSPFSF